MKKTTVTAVIAAGLICMSLASCTDNKNPGTTVDRAPLNSTIGIQPEKAHFTFLEHNQESPLTLQSSDKQTLYISSSAEKASFVAENRADRPSAKKINEVLTQAYGSNKKLFDSLADALDAYFSQENPDLTTFPWESKIDYSCMRNDGKAISVLETIEMSYAGEVDNSICTSYNFDPATGDLIKQVFYSADDKESFDLADDAMYKKLVAKYGEETISYENVSSSFVELAEECWYFTENGIQIIFNPGSIAPASAGVLDLEYTAEELPELAQKYFN